MKRSEVYSWRVSSEIKSALEHAARAKDLSVGRLLEQIVVNWLTKKSAEELGDEKLQRRIHMESMKYVGSIRGGDPLRAQEASRRSKGIIKKKHARSRTH